MPSALLSPDNDYRFAPSPAPAILSRETWDEAMAGQGGVGPRIRALEAKRSELQDLIDDLSFNGQTRLDEAIVPLIDGVEDQLAALNIQVAATAAANAAILEDFQEVTSVNLEELVASIDAAEAKLSNIETQFNIILAGGLPAAQVQESGARVFVSPAQKAAIGTLQTDLTALVQSVATTVSGLNTAIAAKQSSNQKNQPNGYAGLDANGKVPATALDATVVLQSFTTSGTFTKEADDIAYFVECIGAGGGGGAGSGVYGMGGFPGVTRSRWVMPSDIGATVAIIIGAGGTGASGNGPGAKGGESSFGEIAVAPGGLGGLASSTSSLYMLYSETGAQFTDSEARSNVNIFPGHAEYRANSSLPVLTMDIPTAGAGRSSSVAYAPPLSRRHGRGGTTLGAAGSAPGGGGAASATVNGSTGGNGARGEVRIHRFKK